MKHIELLDCTLRDGGHIVDSAFGEDVIRAILDNLVQSRIDIVEAGFLQNCEYDINRAMFNSIEEASRILPAKTENTRFALLGQADLYDFTKLEPWDGTIDVLRISFHDYDIDEGFDAAKIAIEKGYQVFINPINIMGYSDKQLIEFCERTNELNPYGFTMVDTFGSMKKQDLMRIYHLIDHNLNKGIKIAVHLHENQSLSFSLAQNFIDINSPTRDILIDGSLYGMGRVPGNLCIELIMKYMNDTIGTTYDIEPVYDAIDEYIVELKKKNPWGYSIAYALSAQHKVHRTYSEYLMGQGRLKTKQINQILSQISEEHKTRFNKEYIEELYAAYQEHSIEDTDARNKIKHIIGEKKVLIIAPGPSINEYKEKITDYINQEDKDLVTISANFIWDEIKTDMAFFSNIRRWENFGDKSGTENKIITSNVLASANDHEEKKDLIVVNYSDYAYFKDCIADNCILMLLRLLETIGVKNVIFAGFDGFKSGSNFAMPQMEHEGNHTSDNELAKQVLLALSNSINFEWLTPSIYDEH